MGGDFEPGQCAVGADATIGDHQDRRARQALPGHRQAGSWVQVTDPATSEVGWVYARYVAASEAPRSSAPGREIYATRAGGAGSSFAVFLLLGAGAFPPSRKVRRGRRCLALFRLLTAGRIDAEARSLLQRGDIGIGFGGRFQRLDPSAATLIAQKPTSTVAPSAGCAAPHEIADMRRVCARAEIREADKLRLGGLEHTI